ncbi:Uncharacterized conserved protein [Quadrisphaera granulorum]|uniref:YCII-related domain-containing protein n=1 Tax=Quadrisphaera granulorum TaxID=317664 RepID=A0A316AB12_9ACTN|nr:YciI family protein [Quadrisphaera granulorum]PWJ54965.1 hypothetical protein BXY45_105174 [Quadrisphaera granulorum]SZE95911.1 Uncharacterized conserved protein [Quadrisphaera granulorum]
MTQYMISLYEREAEYATMTPEAWGAVLEAHGAFAQAVADLGGTITGGGVLQPTTTATSIRGGEITDGPFVESKEAFGGFYLIEARDLDHALQIAKLTPTPFGGVEVRPLMDVNAGPAQ